MGVRKECLGVCDMSCRYMHMIILYLSDESEVRVEQERLLNTDNKLIQIFDRANQHTLSVCYY